MPAMSEQQARAIQSACAAALMVSASVADYSTGERHYSNMTMGFDPKAFADALSAAGYEICPTPASPSSPETTGE
jgi:hypothetical protein